MEILSQVYIFLDNISDLFIKRESIEDGDQLYHNISDILRQHHCYKNGKK